MKKIVGSMMGASVLLLGVLAIGSPAVPAATEAPADVTELSVEQPSIDGDEGELAACQGVTLNVKNNRSVKIKALKIEYKSKEDGKWRTESFSDEVIPAGATETVKSNAALEHIEGHKMTHMKLHYKKWCGGKWSVKYTTTDTSFADAKCVYGKTYRLDTNSGGC